MKKRFKKFGLLTAVGLFLAWLFCLPKELFDASYSSVLYDQSGQLLGAHIADDEQWRFPKSDLLPENYVEALLCFEDKRFYSHPGVDPLAMGRALALNVKAGHVVSGGSTITMQLMRMARGKHNRSVKQKIVETFMATRAELRFSKREILNMYAAHAPFGGNVVGLEAAAWRYFGKAPTLLSWAEAATLAVLPNSPALIHPGRNPDQLLKKRNRLLDEMVNQGILSQLDAKLSKLESLPAKAFSLPQIATHYLNFTKEKEGQKIMSDLNKDLQVQINEIVKHRNQILAENEIHNAGVLVLEVKTGKVLAYVGNTINRHFDHSNAVDMIQAERSSGSILKPILYASALQEGLIYPKMLLPDIPSNIHGYRPENYHRNYDGVVKADEALYRSLNVPAVRLLQSYGVEKFKNKLTEAGLSTLHFSANHYGLPLIIGGGEITLWEITHLYADMARVLDSAFENNHDPAMSGPWHYGALWSTVQAMQQVRRPDETGQWQTFSGSQKIAWKTGTSYGFKDAWAVGFTPEYAVGVWVGNADGEGRPGLVGLKAAAPILFDVFRLLPDESEFEPPYDALKELLICEASGHPATSNCTSTQSAWVPNVDYRIAACSYHKRVFMNRELTFQVNRTCFNSEEIVDTTMFVLDATPAYYFQAGNPFYQPLPAFHPNCNSRATFTKQRALEVIYPSTGGKIYIPVDYDGEAQKVICRIAKNQPEEVIYWYLDDQYLGTSQEFNTMTIRPTIGEHKLLAKDAHGNMARSEFEVLSK